MANAAGAMAFDLAFAQDVQAMDEQFFDNLLVMGVTVISTVKCGRIMRYVYNKATKHWQPTVAQPPTPETTEQDSEQSIDHSTRRALGFEDITLTPEPQQQQQQAHLQQQGPAVRQVNQLEVGQQMVPVNDHDDHNNYDHNDNDKASSSHAVVLEHVSRGKRPLGQQIEDLVWNNDLWPGDREQLFKIVEKLQEEVFKLKPITRSSIDDEEPIVGESFGGQFNVIVIVVTM